LNEEEKREQRLSSIPEEDVTQFCLWIKEQNKPTIGKVILTKRLKTSPMVIYGQMSSNMRLMMQMMQS